METRPELASQNAAVSRPRRPLGTAFWIACGWLALVGFGALAHGATPGVKTGLAQRDLLAGISTKNGDWLSTVGRDHWLGVDTNGIDWYSALVLSARNSVVIAGATIVFGFVVGGVLGMIAGYRRGLFDAISSYVVVVMLSMPPLLFVILLISLLSAGPGNYGVDRGLQSTVTRVSFSLGVLSIPLVYRVVRASTITYSSREFVVAARTLGAKTRRILAREILPNVAKPMLAYGLVAAGNVMVIEGSLSVVGIGVGNGTWAWGKMIQSSGRREALDASPWLVLIAGTTLFLTVLSFNFVGDKMRERLEVKDGNL